MSNASPAARAGADRKEGRVVGGPVGAHGGRERTGTTSWLSLLGGRRNNAERGETGFGVLASQDLTETAGRNLARAKEGCCAECLSSADVRHRVFNSSSLTDLTQLARREAQKHKTIDMSVATLWIKTPPFVTVLAAAVHRETAKSLERSYARWRGQAGAPRIVFGNHKSLPFVHALGIRDDYKIISDLV